MVARGLSEANPPPGALLFIENVGNLVCPSLFDLGEDERIALLSVTEGDDKPLKYPHMFASANLLLLNKIDLCPYVDFDVQKAVDAALTINPAISVLEISAKTGEGLQGWYDWLTRKRDSRSSRTSTASR
jgi:hydrogenase nickel incorporation protein HypB